MPSGSGESLGGYTSKGLVFASATDQKPGRHSSQSLSLEMGVWR